MTNQKQEGRKRGEWVGELQSMARHKRGLTRWREGRGRSGLVSFEMRHDTNEESPTGREAERGGGWSGWRLLRRSRHEVGLKHIVQPRLHCYQLAPRRASDTPTDWWPDTLR